MHGAGLVSFALTHRAEWGAAIDRLAAAQVVGWMHDPDSEASLEAGQAERWAEPALAASSRQARVVDS